ncbi:PQQ-dependent sugar dehydrogenase [Chryseolinea sp. H1M3-3]|uniref:PQQ-dependent sugar dehydrogenase n=1 Tax=Chryseolinea sp. H1M3-3 TaxID=3034144 RepID=UPI0023ECB5E8|nr:PQQ-dependent sugar dehydrogenase [Chryseolinea sp. H1M3-3]
MNLKFRFYSILCISALLVIGISCDDDNDGTDMTGDNAITLDLVTDGLSSPLVVVTPPDNSDRLFIVDQGGQIYIVKDDERLQQPFLDISDKIVPRESPQDERGLLGLAFHPEFENNGRFFVFYSGPLSANGPAGWDHTNYVAEYSVMPGSDEANEPSERIILSMDHPQANHNGGMIAFGPDGYLYISVGDGGGANDTDEGHVAGGNGQDITDNLLGSILRIDVDNTEDYGIPADNPFVNVDGFDEIFAFGLRNPYRFCFDPEGRVIVADAGQELYEEINVIEKGGNYGWNIKEGAHCFDHNNPDTSPSSCANEDANGNQLRDPVIEFKNSRSFSDGLGNVSIGGFVYQGDDDSDLNGKYIFGVLTQNPNGMDGAVFAADRNGTTWNYEKLSITNKANNELDEYILGFGQDNSGEVYVLTKAGAENSGKVYKINE